MTAEIALLNKSALAMAADSAVTVGAGDRSPKIFNSVNKLFTISKYEPIGIMVYGSAEVMGVPWGTIIKTYRKQLGKKCLPHVEDYVEDFRRFLKSNRALFPSSGQEEYFRGLVFGVFFDINEQIEKEVKKLIEKSGKVKVAEAQKIIRAEIDKLFNKLKKTNNLPEFSEAIANRLRHKYRKSIKEIQNEIFQKLPLSATDRSKLNQIAGWLFTKAKHRHNRISGVVIAGFGAKDIYPRLYEFQVAGIIENKLQYRLRRDVQIGLGKGQVSASIVPFAQSQVVRGFMEGIDPDLEQLLKEYLVQIFGAYPKILLDNIPNIKGSRKVKMAKKLSAASQDVLKKFNAAFNNYRKEHLVDPVVSTVSVLPKDELAAMAEALVNLTSFKRRFSPDAETVGGPIDVAVLSKGDGFVWIKRKHYFKVELNPNFLTNYFRDE